MPSVAHASCNARLPVASARRLEIDQRAYANGFIVQRCDGAEIDAALAGLPLRGSFMQTMAASKSATYDYLIKLLLIGDSGTPLTAS